MASEEFSGRFNIMLDMAEFVSDRGRIKEVSDFFSEALDKNIYRSTAKQWVTENMIPRNLPDLVQALVDADRLPDSLKVDQVCAWLKVGSDAMENPFRKRGRAKAGHNHVMLSKVYIAVHAVAEELGVDLYELNKAQSDKLYSKIINDVRDRDLEEPDEKLIGELLRE